MSKCGYCGYEGDYHMVLECKATLNEELDTRIKEWLEKENDITEAASILSEITRRYNNTKNRGNE